MKKEILQSKFGFCTGGITTYEFASMNIPFVIICDDKHQLKTAKEWEKRGIGKNYGMVSKNTSQKIGAILDKLLEQELKFNKGRNIVDGKGAKRVGDAILEIFSKE